ncbi:MAG: FecR domain-containing protein [Treponema sp.]|nr:FecR domain-containing protein [Treponema sp.]
MMKKRNTRYRLNKVDYAIFIIFSIAAFAMLYLFYRDLNSFTIKQSEEPVAKIYFKKNVAQRKFLDNDIWEVLTNSSDIFDGDRIRTSKNSEAYTEFNDSDIKIQLHEKSMVQIFKNKKERSVDFIGGEILVSNNSPEEKLVIHTGKKQISVAKESEVKVAIVEPTLGNLSDGENTEESVLIEVISGEVDVSDQTEEESVAVSAGNSLTFLPSEEESDVNHYEILPIVQVPQIMEAGTEKTKQSKMAVFYYNEYDKENGKYNYSYYVPAFELTEKNAFIPAGSFIEITYKGTPTKDLWRFVYQVSTGAEPWERANNFIFTYSSDGQKFKAGEPFEVKTTYKILNTIENTDKAGSDISYEKESLDGSSIWKDFEMKVKVLSVGDKENPPLVESGYSKTVKYDSLTLIKNVWGEGQNDFNYLVSMNMENLFGNVFIPKGTKMKISISGICDSNLKWSHPEIIDSSPEEWKQLLVKNNDYYAERFSDEEIKKDLRFSQSKVFEFYDDLPSSIMGFFSYVVNDIENPPPSFTDFEITFEVQ